MAQEVGVEDIAGTMAPSYGVAVVPESQAESIGTNERDDWEYNTVVYRTTHALGNEDMIRRHKFLTDMRLLFHRKRLTCVSGCHVYSRINPTKVAIPEEWKKNNNSVVGVRITTLIRESRTRE